LDMEGLQDIIDHGYLFDLERKDTEFHVRVRVCGCAQKSPDRNQSFY